MLVNLMAPYKHNLRKSDPFIHPNSALIPSAPGYLLQLSPPQLNKNEPEVHLLNRLSPRPTCRLDSNQWDKQIWPLAYWRYIIPDLDVDLMEAYLATSHTGVKVHVEKKTGNT
ncbi:hypothetical protein FALCPG4_011484 [Fusarium falciforme]